MPTINIHEAKTHLSQIIDRVARGESAAGGLPVPQPRRQRVVPGGDQAPAKAGQGLMTCQRLVGGYMYLRSLMGPEAVMYVFYDNPELVHDCMKTWLALADGASIQNVMEFMMAGDEAEGMPPFEMAGIMGPQSAGITTWPWRMCRSSRYSASSARCSIDMAANMGSDRR